MKPYRRISKLIGCIASLGVALVWFPALADDAPAQPAAAAPAQPAAEAPAQPAVEAPVQPAATVAQADTAPAQPAAQADTAPAQPAVPAAAQPEAAAPAQAAPAPTPTTTITPAQPGGNITLIVLDDVPLTDAIKNLARQAGLNYMLDPRITYGQPDAQGHVNAQPSVSIRWENVTAEQALLALLNNYNLQIVEDSKSKIARITIRDPAAPPPLITKIFQLKYAGPSNIVTSVQNTFSDKRSKVVPDIRTSQLVVLATESDLASVDELISRLDTPTKQVLIEARLLETSMNPKTVKGIDWSGTLAAQRVTFGNGKTTGSDVRTTGTTYGQASGNNFGSQPVPPYVGVPPPTPAPAPGTIYQPTAGRTAGGTALQTLNSVLGGPGIGINTMSGFNPVTAFLNADGVDAVLSFLNAYGETRVISTPRTVTLDNEPAYIEAGTMWPIVNVTAGTANTTGGSSISYSNLTVRLTVTPRISANDKIHLKVNPKVVRLGDVVTSTVGGVNNAVDSFNTRDIDTTVMIPSGETLVMGGLIEDNIQKSTIKVPVLGDIPYIGLLFRQDTKTRKKSNMIVFITPTIVQDNDFQPTKEHFLKTPVPRSDELEGDWSAWDSGKPIQYPLPKSMLPAPMPPEGTTAGVLND